MLNKAILIGNLGGDPEIKNYENETQLANLTLATNENYKDKSGEWQQTTEWHRIVAWGHLAKRCEAKMQKGTKVYIEGKLTNRSWQTESGETRYITEVRASVIKILSGGKESEYSNNTPPPPHPPQTTSSTPDYDDDLPF